MALKGGDRSVHCFSSSMAFSKFLTYSAYIFRKGARFSRMSPIRGVDDLRRRERREGERGGERERERERSEERRAGKECRSRWSPDN